MVLAFKPCPRCADNLRQSYASEPPMCLICGYTDYAYRTQKEIDWISDGQRRAKGPKPGRKPKKRKKARA